MFFQSLIQADALCLGLFREILHPFFSQVPFRDIDNAPKGQIILIGYHPEIGQGVLHLRPVKKAHAAV